MPDLMTHVLVAHAVRRGVEIVRGRAWPAREAALYYVGTCLPDLLGRAPAFVFRGYRAALMISGLHAPVFSALASFCGALFLPGPLRVRGFALLCAGAALHYLLDWLQAPLDFYGEDWLFPLPWRVEHLGLFWPDETPLALPWIAGGVAALEGVFFLRTRLGS